MVVGSSDLSLGGKFLLCAAIPQRPRGALGFLGFSMGAAASAQEKGELQQAYAAYDKALTSTDESGTTKATPIGNDDFMTLLRQHAPGLLAKAAAGGGASTAEEAAKALKSQFDTARRKLKMMTQ